ncbi:MAG: lysophospholipid acyltransferase family protein [Akkermansiaceae bacterium]|nr:lysophospholipid acyltransferase family protein [Akkermansiaceae bacterium]
MTRQEELRNRISKRSTRWTPLLGHFLWGIIQCICLTLRIRFRLETGAASSWKTRPVIVALWHNRTFVPCYVYRKMGFSPPMCVLTSASKDGALLEIVAKHYRMAAIRGSSGRRGVTAFMEMTHCMRQGYSMCITPDGPKGPRYTVHPGAVKLASMSGVPIVPVCIDYSACWRIGKAWDGYAIPKPFSKVSLLWGKELTVPPDLDENGLQKFCLQLTERLCLGRPDFSPIKPSDHA